MWRRILVVVVIVLALGGFGFWYWFIRDTAPPPAALPPRNTVATKSGPDGTYAVKTADTTFAGFRIEEEFGGNLNHTAVVRTPAVTGSLTLQGKAVSGVTVTADLTQLESKDSQPPGVPGVENRVRSLEFQGLEISKFPNSKFALISPITLSSVPTVGATESATAHGKLTLHGVTKDVTIPIKARWNGALIDVTGTMPITLADYSITAPSRPFVSVSNHGTMEFDLTFAK